ncbi:uncharacterized protein LOC144477938 [Augochlora pura]
MKDTYRFRPDEWRAVVGRHLSHTMQILIIVAAREMDVFRRNYTIYYCILRFTGLWPFDESALSKIHRICFSLIPMTCIVVQANTVQYVEITLNNLLPLLTFCCPMLLFYLRYLGFIVNFPMVRSFIRNIEYDCITIQNPIEANLLMKHIQKTKIVIKLFLGLAFTGMCCICLKLLLPTLLQSKYQLHVLQFCGFFYFEQSRQADWASIHIILTVTIGLLTIVCTEGALTVFGLYLCGLFEVVSYRIEEAVNNTAKIIATRPVAIGPAMDMYQRAYKLAKSVGHNVVISYLLAIMVVVISFAMNLYKASVMVSDIQSIDDTITCILIVLIHLIIIFLNNYSGQQLFNTSVDVFYHTYNSLWYRMPPKSQKLLLLILMQSAPGVQFNLAGLFSPCYEGFTTMMSSSFSYFTVLCSI